MCALAVLINAVIILSGATYHAQIVFINDVIRQTGTEVNDFSLTDAKIIEKSLYESLETDFVDLLGYIPGSVDEMYEHLPGRECDIRNYDVISNMINRAENAKENAAVGSIYFTTDIMTVLYELLVEKVLPMMYFELSVIGMLVVLKSMGYEFNNNTTCCVYSSTVGRELQKIKLVSCLMFTFILFVLIYFTSLFFYFRIYPMSAFMDSPLESVNNTVSSQFSFTFLGFLIGHICIVYFITLIFSLTSFIIAQFVVNQYMVIVVQMIMQAVFIAGSSLQSNWSKLFSYSPITLLINVESGGEISINTSKWIINGSVIFQSETFVFNVVIIWLLLCAFGIKLSTRRFKMRDIQ